MSNERWDRREELAKEVGISAAEVLLVLEKMFGEDYELMLGTLILAAAKVMISAGMTEKPADFAYHVGHVFEQLKGQRH